MRVNGKRLLITLVLSSGIWIVTSIIQVYFRLGKTSSFSFLGDSCTVTGLPLAFCFKDYELFSALAVWSLNILFWFWVLHFFWNFFNKTKR